MKKFMSLFIIAAAFMACTDDDIRTEQNFSQGPKVVGFAAPLVSVAYFEDDGTILRQFPLNLIGNSNGQPSATDIEVSYTVDPASTAADGLEYNMVETTGKITIPAGTTFGYFPLEVNTGSLNPTQKTELILNLTTSSPGSVIGAQYSKVRIVFVGCLSELQGNYKSVICQPAGCATRNNDVVTMIDINTFRTKWVGTFPVDPNIPAGYEFVDICGELTLLSDQTLGLYPNKVYGIDQYGADIDGLVISPTSFKMTHNIGFTAGDVTFNYTYTRN